jgi:hypothetical protein
VNSRVQNRVTSAELEHIKDKSAIALFKADACLANKALVSEART